MEQLTFTIPLDPKSKKNSQQIIYIGGKPRIVQGTVYKKYAKLCAPHMPFLKAPINEPVNLKCVFYRQTRRPIDLSNLQAAICDILVEYGILADDCRDIVAAMDGSEVLYDKENPRTEVTITAIGKEYGQWKEWTE